MITYIYHAITQSRQWHKARDDIILPLFFHCKKLKTTYYLSTSRRENHDKKRN